MTDPWVNPSQKFWVSNHSSSITSVNVHSRAVKFFSLFAGQQCSWLTMFRSKTQRHYVVQYIFSLSGYIAVQVHFSCTSVSEQITPKIILGLKGLGEPFIIHMTVTFSPYSDCPQFSNVFSTLFSVTFVVFDEETMQCDSQLNWQWLSQSAASSSFIVVTQYIRFSLWICCYIRGKYLTK